MTTTLTPNFQIAIPDFLTAPWHNDLIIAFQRVDAIMYGVAAAVGAPPWQNSKAYVKGNLALDAVTDTMYFCETPHTSSAAPTLFSADRTADPTRWTAIIPVT